MQTKKQTKKICRYEFYCETSFILKDIVTRYFGKYKLNLNYESWDSKTKITINRKNDMELTITLNDEQLFYEVVLNNKKKIYCYVKYDEVLDYDKWNKYEAQLKEDFHNLIDYLCSHNYDEKDVSYCEYRYSEDYVAEKRRKRDYFDF